MAPKPSNWVPSKVKVQLKLAMNRLQLFANKKAVQVKNQKAAVAGLLLEGKEEEARIRAEALIRYVLYPTPQF